MYWETMGVEGEKNLAWLLILFPVGFYIEHLIEVIKD